MTVSSPLGHALDSRASGSDVPRGACTTSTGLAGTEMSPPSVGKRAIPTVADPSPKGLGGPDQNTPGIAQEIFHGPAFERGSVQLSKGRGIVSSSCIPPSVCASREEPASRCMRDHSGDSAATETFRAHVWRILEERPRRRQAKKSSQVGVHISMRSGVQQVALIEPRTFGPGKITMSRQQAEGIGSCWLSRRRRNVVYRSASWKLLPGNSHQKKQEDQAAHLRIPSPTPPPLVDMGPQGTSLPWTEDKKISLKRKETSVEPNAACRRTVFRPSRPSPAGSIVASMRTRPLPPPPSLILGRELPNAAPCRPSPQAPPRATGARRGLATREGVRGFAIAPYQILAGTLADGGGVTGRTKSNQREPLAHAGLVEEMGGRRGRRIAD
ncbi:unnamed protein product [Diplocarpon coronariae]|nr:hypothetical protein JHW43_008496 [Diplocarpon mali]